MTDPTLIELLDAAVAHYGKMRDGSIPQMATHLSAAAARLREEMDIEPMDDPGGYVRAAIARINGGGPSTGPGEAK